MRLRVLGSGCWLADARRGAPGFLLRSGEDTVLVEAGSGTLQRLARAGLDPVALDAVVLSHRHLDHCADLAPLLFCMKHQRSPARLRDLLVAGSTGTAHHLEGLRALHGTSLCAEHFGVRTSELPLDGPGRLLLPGGTLLESAPAVHAEGALHLRFTDPDGTALVFSGDTGPSEALEQLAAGADLLVCECALPPDDAFPFHLSARDVAQLAAAARPRGVLLCHYYPRLDAEADVALVARCGVPCRWAEDGDELRVARSERIPLPEV